MDNFIATFITTMAKSKLAGFLIGIGVIANITAANPVLGAFLFSLGLLAIMQLQLQLFTGKVGDLIYAKKENKLLPFIFLGNVIGIETAIICYACANPNFDAALQAASAAKFSKDYFQMLACGIFCGVLIHIAVKSKQFYITILSIMAFILIGAEHCIADIPYLVKSFSFVNLSKFGLVVLGNISGSLYAERLSGFYDKVRGDK